MNEKCPCKREKCERHGDCVACRTHHAQFKRKLSVAFERKQKNFDHL